MKNIIAVIGLAGCLGMSLNICLQLIIAGFHRKTIRLVFNRYHEYWFELILCLACLALGVYSLIYMMG